MSNVAFERRSFAGDATDTTLATGCSATDLTFTVQSTSGWEDGADGPFYVVIDPGGTEEKVRVNGRIGNVLTIGNTTDRGMDGTIAAAHDPGVVVRVCYTAIDADEANRLVAETIGQVRGKGDLIVATDAGEFGVLAHPGADGLTPVTDLTTDTGYGFEQTITDADLVVLNAEIAGKAPTVHNHAESDVIGLTVPWTAYTPVWLASTTNPTAGNSTLHGRYMQVGKVVHFAIELVVGSTAAIGTGDYSFTLPTPVSASLIPTVCLAEAFDSSASAVVLGVGVVAPSANTIFVLAVDSSHWGRTSPFAGGAFWATGDILRISGFYEAL